MLNTSLIGKNYRKIIYYSYTKKLRRKLLKGILIFIN